ncbi:MAG: hypothetical protein EOP45_11680 [Sphingobacteriaceae bacterium]|nr:MAG: hypothetical protein EOP45_11680 [Sphingobacteriaceae bacterium]
MNEIFPYRSDPRLNRVRDYLNGAVAQNLPELLDQWFIFKKQQLPRNVNVRQIQKLTDGIISNHYIPFMYNQMRARPPHQLTTEEIAKVNELLLSLEQDMTSIRRKLRWPSMGDRYIARRIIEQIGRKDILKTMAKSKRGTEAVWTEFWVNRT